MSGNVGVTGITTSIYPNEGRQSIDLPSIVYTVVSDVPNNSKSGFNTSVARVQVSCFDELYEDAMALALVVRTALADKALGTYGGILTHNIKFEGSQDLKNDSGDEGINHIMLEFLIYYVNG